MEKKEADLNKYLQDIGTIKSLLLKTEENPMIEYWAFITWGLFIILGCILEFITVKYFDFTIIDAMYKIWLPVIIVAGILESIAWVIRTTKESLPLISKPILKFFGSYILIAIVYIVIFNLIMKTGLTDYFHVIMSLMVGTFFLLFGISAYTPMLFYACILILYGTVLYFTEIQNEIISLITGFIIAGSFIAAGITAKIDQREK